MERAMGDDTVIDDVVEDPVDALILRIDEAMSSGLGYRARFRAYGAIANDASAFLVGGVWRSADILDCLCERPGAGAKLRVALAEDANASLVDPADVAFLFDGLGFEARVFVAILIEHRLIRRAAVAEASVL
jgi:hypothetical protein